MSIPTQAEQSARMLADFAEGASPGIEKAIREMFDGLVDEMVADGRLKVTTLQPEVFGHDAHAVLVQYVPDDQESA